MQISSGLILFSHLITMFNNADITFIGLLMFNVTFDFEIIYYIVFGPFLTTLKKIKCLSNQ